jgi:hypothetical protein
MFNLLVWKALVGLVVFDILGLNTNFAKMHRLVGNWRIARIAASGDMVDRVCTSVNYACVWYPKRVLCLQRSAVTTCLLRTCGITANMLIGTEHLPFRAHAWTEVSGRAINERRDVKRIYRVLDRC